MPHYREDIAKINLETGTVFRSFMNRSLGEGDIGADRFGVEVYRNGVPEQLGSASCIGYFIRPTGDTVVISGGVVTGNRAYITLPQACYAYEGYFTLAIKLSGGNVTGTLRIVDGTVAQTTTETVIDPGDVVPDLTTLLAQIDRLEAANAEAETFFPAAGGAEGQLLSKTSSGTAWANPPTEIFIATFNVTTFAQVKAAWQAGRIIRVKFQYADRPMEDLLCEENTNYYRFTKFTDNLGSDSDIGLYEITVQSDNTWSMGYVSPAQKKLVSGTTIKTINGESLLGSGNIDVSGGGGSGAVNSVNGKTGTVVLNAADVGAQPTLVSGTNIKTVNNQSLLGAGNITISGGGAVNSVNGQTGTVVLDAEDVGALPDSTTIPTQLSQLTADSTHRTVTDTEKSTWNGKGTYSKPSTGIPKTDLASAVQTSLGKADSAYQKPSSGIPKTDLASAVQTSLGKADNAQPLLVSGTTIKTINGTSLLGSGNIDVSGGGGGGSVDSVNGKTGTVVLDAEDVGALPDTTTIPSALSQLSDDSSHRTVTDTEKSTWNSKQSAISDLNTIRSGAAAGATAVQPGSLATVATSGSYNDLSSKPTIPTQLSQLSDDSTHRTVTDTEKSTWNGKGTYSKPSTGIPKTDLASAVQTSLGNADSAYQKPSSGIPKTDLASAVQTSLGKADSAYQKPSSGIPKSDLASAVQTSLGKADSALQSSALSAYRTASAQDTIDAGKQPKLTAGANITIDPTTNTISATGGGGSGSVNSVNGQTGTVVLDAEDVGAIGKHGVAVVFGDSIFDCGTAQAPIKFANYLRQQNIYSEVRDFAKGVTGFGDTYEGQYGKYSLYEMLCDSTSPKYTEARQAVRDAEIIYMHLGGNDMMSAAEGSADEDIFIKVTACFEEIFELNPAVIIKYVPFIRFDNFDLMMRAFPDYTDTQFLSILKVFSTIMDVIETTASNNVKEADITSSANIRVRSDGMHPDDMDAALNLYDGIVYGGYSDFSSSLSFATATVVDGTITDEYLSPEYKEMMLSTSTLNTKLLVTNIVTGVGITFHMYDALSNTHDHIEWQTEEPGKSIKLDSNGFSFVQRGGSGGFVVSDTAPSNTGVLWIDTTVTGLDEYGGEVE